MSEDRLDALERRGDELEAFASAERQAAKWIREYGTDALVAELRHARERRRRVRLGTPNALILLAHIDRLEAEIAGDPVTVGSEGGVPGGR